MSNSRPGKCSAISKRTGQPCGAMAMSNGKCYHHGGATPRGIANANTKSGRYSKDLPTRLAAKYEAALTDPRLLELRDELALVDARLSDLIAGLDTGEAGQIWRELRDARRDLNDEAKRADALATIIRLIDKGAAEWQRWEDVFRTIERRARLAESERKRLVEAQQMISAEQVNTLIAALVATVRQHVTDANALRGISTDLTRLLNRGADLRH